MAIAKIITRHIEFLDALKQSIKGYTCQSKKIVILILDKESQKLIDVTKYKDEDILKIIDSER